VQRALHESGRQDIVYVQVPDSAPAGVLSGFLDALETFRVDLQRFPPPTSLLGLARSIEALVDAGYIIALDEFQYFNRKHLAEFTSHFQASIDRLASRAANVRGGLVVLGSLHTDLVALLEDRDAPLFNRTTDHILLDHLDIGSVLEVLRVHAEPSPHRLLFLWSLFEGVPKFYRDAHEQGVLASDRAEVLERLFFRSSSPLRTEADNWFLNELRGRYDVILEFVARHPGCQHREAVAHVRELDTNSDEQVGGYFKILIDRYRMIERRQPIFARTTGRSGRYHIRDNFLRSWLAALQAPVSAMSFRPIDELVARADARLEECEGHSLERLVAALYEERSRKAIGDFPLTERISGFWDRGDTEIDLVVLDEGSQRMRLGSCKRNPERLIRDIPRFLGHVERFLVGHRRFKGWRVEPVAFAPVLDADQRAAIASAGVHPEDLNDLSLAFESSRQSQSPRPKGVPATKVPESCPVGAPRVSSRCAGCSAQSQRTPSPAAEWASTRPPAAPSAMQVHLPRARTLVTLLALPLLASEATAQSASRFLFSIDWQGGTVGLSDPTGVPITEGDILVPSTGTGMPALGAPATPTIAVPHAAGGLGLVPFCAGHPGGTPCVVEVDAYSRGLDHRFQPNTPIRPGQIIFSVDEYGAGIPSTLIPTVASEGPVGDAAADTFVNLGGLPPAPLPPFVGRHIGLSDGDGVASGSGSTRPSVGILEPIIAAPGPFNGGDNLDGLDVFQPIAGTVPMGHFFSLDSGFGDPLDLVPNTTSAAIHGFVGGDVLVTPFGGLGPVLYAPAAMLGLDLVGGPDSDDLDALILRENNVPGWQRAPQPFAWMTPNTDMLIFSVRRGSAVIGMPDSLFGMPIMPGDLLLPPIPTALGGVSPFPAIFIAAENLGLATVRMGFPTSDDLVAADAVTNLMYDCDNDGVEDVIGIALFGVLDANLDGVPDVCQSGPVGTPFCFCTPLVAPCGNVFVPGGCLNSVGTGAILSGSGSTSVGLDNLVLTTSGMVPSTFCLTFMSPTGLAIPPTLGNGLLCVGPSIWRLALYPTGTGTASFGPGIVALTLSFPPAGQITAFSTWNFQTWYRDPFGPCGQHSNLSNALSVTFTP